MSRVAERVAQHHLYRKLKNSASDSAPAEEYPAVRRI
jgi:hypothetical protein